MGLIDVIEFYPIGWTNNVGRHEIIGEALWPITLRGGLVTLVQLPDMPLKLPDLPLNIVDPLKSDFRVELC